MAGPDLISAHPVKGCRNTSECSHCAPQQLEELIDCTHEAQLPGLSMSGISSGAVVGWIGELGTHVEWTIDQGRAACTHSRTVIVNTHREIATSVINVAYKHDYIIEGLWATTTTLPPPPPPPPPARRPIPDKSSHHNRAL